MYQRPRPTGVGFLSRLPGVSEEIRAIQATLSAAGYKVHTPLIINDEQQADSVPLFLQQQMAEKRLIHIAGHGLFDSTDNMASALLLGGNNERGVVRASDLLVADLRGVDLVALSACQTGDVNVRAGQEAFGFVRALLMAGARRAIVSQWKVDDAATQKWFTAMYRHLAEHDDIERAYQSATLQMAQQKQHPFYWAAFTLYSRGEGSSNPNGAEALPPPTAAAAPPPLTPVQAGIPRDKGATKLEPQKKTSKPKAPDWRTEVFSR
jgi:CHAT domain-containing protein